MWIHGIHLFAGVFGKDGFGTNVISTYTQDLGGSLFLGIIGWIYQFYTIARGYWVGCEELFNEVDELDWMGMNTYTHGNTFFTNHNCGM